jgi:hypothetical protein
MEKKKEKRKKKNEERKTKNEKLVVSMAEPRKTCGEHCRIEWTLVLTSGRIIKSRRFFNYGIKPKI